MPLGPDDTVCYCFHVPLRKIESFCHAARPKVPSQISECLSAGTGCGWCIPMLRKVHSRICGEYKPWWKESGKGEYTSTEREADIDQIDAEEYGAGRQKYLKETDRKPPAE